MLRRILACWCTSFILLPVGACGGGGDSGRDEAPEYSHGTCPTLEAGVQSFASGELVYEVTIQLPAEPKGAPVVFVFHGLDGTAERIGERLEVERLVALGARIVLCDPHRAVVVGPALLHGGPMYSPDIRAGMALLIASLCASGESVIHNIHQIDRGYERIETKLQALGARIERV